MRSIFFSAQQAKSHRILQPNHLHAKRRGNDEQHSTNVWSARVQTKLHIAWGSKRKLKPIRYGAGDRGMDGCTERAAWGSKRILICQSTKYTRGGTRTRNLLLRREAPYPLGHTSLCLGMMFDIERPDMIASVTSRAQNRNAKARQRNQKRHP